jgi:hypothetical protein
MQLKTETGKGKDEDLTFPVHDSNLRVTEGEDYCK